MQISIETLQLSAYIMFSMAFFLALYDFLVVKPIKKGEYAELFELVAFFYGGRSLFDEVIYRFFLLALLCGVLVGSYIYFPSVFVAILMFLVIYHLVNGLTRLSKNPWQKGTEFYHKHQSNMRWNFIFVLSLLGMCLILTVRS